MVAVAQLVESQIVILVVVGSSPISHPSSFRSSQRPPEAAPRALISLKIHLPLR